MSDALARLIRETQSEHRLPSVSAAVVVRGEPALELAVGFADDAAGREASLDTQYRIGSITKTFTAAASWRSSTRARSASTTRSAGTCRRPAAGR